jgi:hypothetical protein
MVDVAAADMPSIIGPGTDKHMQQEAVDCCGCTVIVTLAKTRWLRATCSSSAILWTGLLLQGLPLP